MNVNILNSKYKVVSRYFTGKTVMDESLADFKEKKSYKISTNNNKAPATKLKVKKVKQVKGQKDIRTALKPKKNELIAYSEHFATECKKSGIDVDSEQLQLAIALSKSLQTTEGSGSTSSSSKSLTSQQRSTNIRTTLKEYGFKVPEKPGQAARKTKKRRKPYKLLLTSDEEKQQIITDRYSQVLFELNSLKTTGNKDIVKPDLFFYNMSTNIEFENIKKDSIFYVKGLIEESPNNMGCLLKNWSDIPGRPLSPKLDKSELMFSEIECSQEEMDIVLSGRLKYSKDILKNKNLFKDGGESMKTVKKNMDTTITETDPILVEEYDDNQSSPVVSTLSSNIDNIKINEKSEKSSIIIDLEDKNLLAVTQTTRSLSPDLFDDEDDASDEVRNKTMTECPVKPVNNVTRKASDVMDLTECVNILSQNSKSMKSVSQLSQQVDVTKRRSNDFMEITKCVGGPSQPILERIEKQIDLTGQCENLNEPTKESIYIKAVEIGENISACFQPTQKKNYDHIDLTAFCENDVHTEINSASYDNVAIRDHSKSTDNCKYEHVDLTGNYANNLEKENTSAMVDNMDHMDLTQSSSSSTDTLPFVHISGKQAVTEKSLDDTIILNENDYVEKNPASLDKETKRSSNEKQTLSVEIETNKTSTIAIECSEDLSLKNGENVIINLDETCEVPIREDNVDLTQTSESNEASDIISNNISHQINNSSLGKKDNVSVDYDEALENMNSFPYYNHDGIDDISTELIGKHSPITKDKANLSNRRQSSLELLEAESNSPCKTKTMENHFDFGGISVIDNLPSFNRKSRNTINSIPDGSLSESLPMVNIKGKASPQKLKSQFEELLGPVAEPINDQNIVNEKPTNTEAQTPQTKVNRHLNIETPEQSEYIVKTDNVTPMLDYALMSTPERNRELDKYGLKPFKRKRAIQLLTHLYNQTHPFVESTEEYTSPTKKRKKESLSQPSSSKLSSRTCLSPRNKSLSPWKTSQSPRRHLSSADKCAGDFENLNGSDKENELFMVTNEVPAIKNVECDADDWFFQKREKAKLYSCRVPLHIAFHNYVSCRRLLHEAILRYEPVNIDVIHKELAASGHRYDPKDLLKFMDKKCITVKTADNIKNNRRY